MFISIFCRIKSESNRSLVARSAVYFSDLTQAASENRWFLSDYSVIEYNSVTYD